MAVEDGGEPVGIPRLLRTWLRGRENVHKRYLIHVAGHNLGILMRHLIGAGTPKEAAARGRVLLFVVLVLTAATRRPRAASESRSAGRWGGRCSCAASGRANRRYDPNPQAAWR